MVALPSDFDSPHILKSERIFAGNLSVTKMIGLVVDKNDIYALDVLALVLLLSLLPQHQVLLEFQVWILVSIALV